MTTAFATLAALYALARIEQWFLWRQRGEVKGGRFDIKPFNLICTLYMHKWKPTGKALTCERCGATLQ